VSRRTDQRRAAVFALYQHDVTGREVDDVLERDASTFTRALTYAADDYQADLTLADVRDQSIFLATRTGDGTALPVEDGGPTRIVFADGLADRFSPDMWIWNIETIEVR